MGINVDRTGTFRALLLEKGISKTREKGYPQLVAKVKLIELYDENGGEDGKGCWFDISDWDMETNVYQCLYGVNKKSQQVEPTLSHEQVMKVFEWDGVSLAELDKASHEGLKFQVRVTENTYEGARSPFQVSWIDDYDADPVYTLRKLDAAEVKDLDKQFSNITASAKTAVSAKSPKAASKKPHPARVPADDGKKPVKPTAPKDPAKMTPAEKKAALKAKSAKIKAANKQEADKKKQAAMPEPTRAKPTAPPPPEDENGTSIAPPIPEATESITKAEAWAKIYEMRDPTIDDETVKALWDAAIEEVAGEGAKHADLTGEQWFQVKEIVLKDCGKF
jgi:hypothetical protein